MNQSLLKLRNRLLTGREKHPFDRHYEVRRCDVHPGLKVVVTIRTQVSDGMPQIMRDSELFDALVHPEKYQWFGKGVFSILKGREIHLTFSTEPALKDGHWFASCVDKAGKEYKCLLFLLGIVPDYVLRPKGNIFEPAGWHPLNFCFFR